LAKINISLRSITFNNIYPNRLYVKSLYKRYLTNALNWYIRRDLWRNKAIEIRADFERNRCVWLSILDEVMRQRKTYEERRLRASMDGRRARSRGTASRRKQKTDRWTKDEVDFEVRSKEPVDTSHARLHRPHLDSSIPASSDR
jgi:hypothetical protein